MMSNKENVYCVVYATVNMTYIEYLRVKKNASNILQ